MIELEFREIKFRAFDTENKTWTFVTLGDLICGVCTEKGDKPLSGEKQVWEQYTGLKDKDGKEIYEGDIVDYNDDGDCIGYVVYNAPNYEIMEKIGYPCWLKGGPHQRVIGNIHENPELLEKLNESY